MSDQAGSALADQVKSFGATATGLSRNPLGIIALFIVLVYGLASLVTVLGSFLGAFERLLLIVFLVSFPFAVLAAFIWLVRQPALTYGPSDFKDEQNYLKMIASLAAAAAKGGDGSGQKVIDSSEIVNSASRLYIKSKALRRSREEPRLLWVDDNPSNNTYLRSALEDVGIGVTEALSTDQALDLLAKERFDVIISDMARKEGPDEGYVLLESVRNRGMHTPFFVFSSSGAAKHRRMANERGAQGATNNGEELLDFVLTAIGPR